MTRLGSITAILAAASLGSFARSDDRLAEDRALLAQAAAQRPAPSRPASNAPAPIAAADPHADGRVKAPAARPAAALDAEARASAEAALANARLELIRGRKADKNNEPHKAAEHAGRALHYLAAIPTSVDVSDYQLQSEGLLARARKAGIDVDAILAEPALGQMQSQPAASKGEAISITTIPPASGASDAGAPPTATTAAPTAIALDSNRAAPTAAPIHNDDVTGLPHQVRQRERIATDDVRHLVEADDARITPDGEVGYPADWKQRVARRQKNAGGEIAKSDSWRDADGRERYVAIYDVRDVTYVAPDFRPMSLTIAESLRDTLDRDALRHRSLIFGGDALDLAQGIPLLHYFGGVDEMALRGPKYSAQRQRDVVEMIKGVTSHDAENKVVLLDP